MRGGRTERARRAVASAVVGALGVLVAGCAEEAAEPLRPVESGASTTTTVVGSTTTVADPGAAPPSSTASTASATPADPVRAEVEQAYRNAIRAFEEAAAIPDANYAPLLRWNAGPMLEARIATLVSFRLQGRVAHYPTNSKRYIKVTAFAKLDDQTAVLETCQVDDGVVSEVATGRVVNDIVSAVEMRSVMKKADDRWVLSEREELRVLEDISCDR